MQHTRVTGAILQRGEVNHQSIEPKLVLCPVGTLDHTLHLWHPGVLPGANYQVLHLEAFAQQRGLAGVLGPNYGYHWQRSCLEQRLAQATHLACKHQQPKRGLHCGSSLRTGCRQVLAQHLAVDVAQFTFALSNPLQLICDLLRREAGSDVVLNARNWRRKTRLVATDVAILRLDGQVQLAQAQRVVAGASYLVPTPSDFREPPVQGLFEEALVAPPAKLHQR